VSAEKTERKTVGGKRPGSGRKPGVPNRVTRTIKEAIETTLQSLQRTKKHNLLAWAKANPTEFYKLAGKLIPHSMQVTGKLTLEQLLTEAEKGDASGS
jgi:hypothetical protein